MKKIGWMIVALSLSLSVAASASSVGNQKPASKSKTEQPKNQRPSRGKAVRGDQANLIAQLKQEHQVAMNELQEIRKLAAEEKATKTLGALDKLMTRRNQEFQQRLQKLEAQGKGGEKDKGKGSDDKEGQKQNTGKAKTRGR
ncbi:MAG: hypothetical protein M1376_06345 [Planctomycetes bacterium]|nr:hypothetical protein [Planctomycetota bacterium]